MRGNKSIQYQSQRGEASALVLAVASWAGLMGLIGVHQFASPESSGNLALNAGARLSDSESETGSAIEAAYLVNTRSSFPEIWNMAIGPAAGYSHFENKPKSMFKGKMDIVPLLGKVRISIGKPRSGNFFLEAGGGYYIVDHDIDAGTARQFSQAGVEIKDDVDDAWGGVVGGGFVLPIVEDFELGLRAEKHIVQADLTSQITDTSSGSTIKLDDSVNLGSFNVTANLNVAFGPR